MFSGIIQAVGHITAIKKNTDGAVLKVAVGDLSKHVFALGDSIAVNGACLTAMDFMDDCFFADVSNTSLRLTNLGDLEVGSLVNLEPALTLNQALNGHLVSGHIDCTVTISHIEESGFSRLVEFLLPQAYNNFVVSSGSVTLDGVSLTVNRADDKTAKLTLVPHTLKQTILKNWKVGSKLNFEVDMVARYLLDKKTNLKLNPA